MSLQRLERREVKASKYRVEKERKMVKNEHRVKNYKIKSSLKLAIVVMPVTLVLGKWR